MSYTIRYAPDSLTEKKEKQPYFGLAGAIVTILVCAAAIGWAIPQHAEEFAHALFPWTRTEVRAAMAELREDIHEGQSLGDALTAFCTEIIHNAEISQ